MTGGPGRVPYRPSPLYWSLPVIAILVAIAAWYFLVYDTAEGKCNRGDYGACLVVYAKHAAETAASASAQAAASASQAAQVAQAQASAAAAEADASASASAVAQQAEAQRQAAFAAACARYHGRVNGFAVCEVWYAQADGFTNGGVYDVPLGADGSWDRQQADTNKAQCTEAQHGSPVTYWPDTGVCAFADTTGPQPRP
jgi:hypothetical protein